ncbi:MAG TPA: HK97 family phage prohead protease [Planctomycetota bacterium]|nr:HK97 family phage prohead protease [Planctomycetota bacterium]
MDIDRAFLNESSSIRSVDHSRRAATFVAATERGVDTGRGREYLRMAGLSLSRFKRNPVVLDTHRRQTLENVIGSAEVIIDGRELIATVTFATTQRAETAWLLVKDRMLRALSVGFIADTASITALLPGQTDGSGEGAVVGPGRIINRWQLIEISIVPVPADEHAIRRAIAMTTNPTPAITSPAAKVNPVIALEKEVAEIRSMGARFLSRDAVDEIVLRANGKVSQARPLLLNAMVERLKPVGTPEQPLFTPKKKPSPKVSDESLLKSLILPNG